MPAWINNAIMFWHDGVAYRKITDHGRGPLAVSVERIGKEQRMVDGTLRRHSVAKKRSWSTSWDEVPSKTGVVGYLNTVDGGYGGEQIEAFHNATDGAFNMQLRKGDGTVEVVTVMIKDFSKEVVKRGPGVDLWNMSITLDEV